MDSTSMKCGLIALVGAPNAGKSTLMNALVKEKVGIISPKPNTTRLTVRAVLTRDETQLVFMDTPGLSDKADGLNRLLVQQARGAMAEADVVCFLVDAAKKRLPDLAQMVQGVKGRKVLIFTKVDLVKDKKLLLPMLAAAGEVGFDAVIPLTVRKQNTLDDLLKILFKMVPAGPWLFPDSGMVTDAPLPLRLAELTREQAMRKLHEEVPYGVAVMPVSIEETVEKVEAEDDFEDDSERPGPLLVRQTILLAREAHKPIVLGRKGAMLGDIGKAARLEMQKMLGRGVRLELHVEVDPHWAERNNVLQALGVI
ncbi:MAG TPA: GTPase Era [Alphaproteobacteria bacterium]|nr:GTPase Era [Alphaproteobacteria bacterium]